MDAYKQYLVARKNLGTRRSVLKAIGAASGTTLVAKPATADGSGTYVGVAYNPVTGEIHGEVDADMNSVKDSLKGTVRISTDLLGSGTHVVPLSAGRPDKKTDLSANRPIQTEVGYDYSGVSNEDNAVAFTIGSIQDKSISGLLRPTEEMGKRQAIHLKKVANGESKETIRSDVETAMEHHVTLKNVEEVTY